MSDEWERSRTRWRAAQPNDALTWYRQISGYSFIAAAARHGAFGPGARILEIGPGYGRLLQACLDADVPFARYLGVDIAPAVVDYLRNEFQDPRIAFEVADVDTMELDERFDVLLASLVFKHLYPSFETALKRCVRYLDSGALICFDVLEGDTRLWDGSEGESYIRAYTRAELTTVVGDCGLKMVGFTDVEHDVDVRRLMAIARKP